MDRNSDFDPARVAPPALLPPRLVGQPDQFAKRTFAQETAPLTHGVVTWKDPPEISLTHIQGDGGFLVRRSGHLPRLDPPWSYVRGHDEIQLEIKMAGDHLGLGAIERILLRRQAWQVERVEDLEAPFTGQGPIWTIAPRVPEVLRDVWKVRRSARGCYHVEPFVFPFLWVAANELPLREDLVPFLVARSGRALDDFGRWVATRRPAEWVLDMVQYTAMSTSARAQVINSVETDDPEVIARQRHLVKLLFAKHPELQQELTEELRAVERKEGRKEGRRKGRLAEARAILRRLLARRGFELSADDEARIDACTTLATLEHWIDEAVVVSSAAEALGLPRQA
jgi:hypothetical protein